MKTMQPVLPPATTKFEEWARWLNRMETQLRTLPSYSKKVIKVQYEAIEFIESFKV